MNVIRIDVAGHIVIVNGRKNDSCFVIYNPKKEGNGYKFPMYAGLTNIRFVTLGQFTRGNQKLLMANGTP